jgi:glycosyltransferase involved in cell wall biosynthesis
MLTVIIPTDESERVLVRTLASLVPGATAGLIRDVILADAGSRDETEKVGDIAGCRFMKLAGSRGVRMTAAAGEARGDWLLFLMPGTVLEPEWVGEVLSFVESADADASAVFRKARSAKAPASAWSEIAEILRAAIGGKPDAVQGLLIARRRYQSLGGHGDGANPERALIGRIGPRNLVWLRSGAAMPRP